MCPDSGCSVQDGRGRQEAVTYDVGGLFAPIGISGTAPLVPLSNTLLTPNASCVYFVH